jgi:hypothetical protein
MLSFCASLALAILEFAVEHALRRLGEGGGGEKEGAEYEAEEGKRGNCPCEIGNNQWSFFHFSPRPFKGETRLTFSEVAAPPAFSQPVESLFLFNSSSLFCQ